MSIFNCNITPVNLGSFQSAARLTFAQSINLHIVANLQTDWELRHLALRGHKKKADTRIIRVLGIGVNDLDVALKEARRDLRLKRSPPAVQYMKQNPIDGLKAAQQRLDESHQHGGFCLN